MLVLDMASPKTSKPKKPVVKIPDARYRRTVVTRRRLELRRPRGRVMNTDTQVAQETLGARLGVRFLPMPETLEALLTPTGGLLVRAAGSLADLEARALLALAYFDVRR